MTNPLAKDLCYMTKNEETSNNIHKKLSALPNVNRLADICIFDSWMRNILAFLKIQK